MVAMRPIKTTDPIETPIAMYFLLTTTPPEVVEIGMLLVPAIPEVARPDVAVFVVEVAAVVVVLLASLELAC
jgi:hypothetical protein